MKRKLLTLLTLLLCAVGGAWGEEAIISWQLGTNGAEATGANSITGATGSAAAGFTIAITGNAEKSWSNGNGSITYNSTTYKTLKNSNGAQNTITLPTGKVATQVKFYVVTNADTAGKLSEIDGTTCNDEVSSLKDYSNPTVITKSINNKNSFTFTFSTKQVCFIAVVTYTNASATTYEMNVAVNNNDYGTATVSSASVYEGSNATFTATPNTGYKFVNWTNTEGGSLVSTSNPYTINNVTAAYSLTANFGVAKAITFSGYDDYDGTRSESPLAATVYADDNDKYTAPTNLYLSSDNKTLTGWSDGSTIYNVGSEIDCSAGNKTLTPVFTANSGTTMSATLDARTAAFTTTWQVGNNYCNFALQGNTGYYVQQATINGTKVDIPMYINTTSGKFNNEGNNNTRAQVNNGTVLTLPVVNGSIVTIDAYHAFGTTDRNGNNCTQTTINGTTSYDTSTNSGKTAIYTHNGDAGTISINVGGDAAWINYISVKYPKPVEPLTAVSDYTWDFTSASAFTDAASADKTYTEETNVNNVLIGNGATLKKAESNKSQRLMLNQQGTTSGYYVKIKVSAHSKITVSAVGGTDRKIRFAENTVGGTVLSTLDCDGTQSDKVLDDTGEGEKTICIYNPASGNITLYSIKVEAASSAVPTVTLVSTFSATVGVANELTATVSAYPAVTAYQWYQCDDANKTNPQAVENATTEALTFTPAATGTLYYYLTATNSVGTTTSDVCTVTVKEPDLNLTVQVNNQSGTMLTSEEYAAQNTDISFGVNINNERVAVDATSAVMTVSGKYHSDHGMTNAVFTVKVPGKVKISVGECTYSTSTITVKNSNNETVASATPEAACWKNSPSNVAVLYYGGDATTLTISGMSYCPYIAIESVEELPAQYTATFMNGSTTVGTITVYAGSALGTLPTPEYDNTTKRFRGYYTGSDGWGTKATTATVPTANITYYASIMDIPTQMAGYYVVSDGLSLLNAMEYASEVSTSSNPAKIFLKNGTYDWGTAAETQLTGSHISIIGESLDGTILSTIPAQEGLGEGTLLTNKGNYNYLQDLTLHNNYPYGNSTGRAASLKDEGNYTICKNVWLYSHQDTYYSHKSGGYFYFNGGKISGCVDYMCGQSRVYYDGVTLSNDNRTTYMTANSELYVFNNCTVENGGSTYYFGRAWGSVNGGPVCVFLNTTLKDNGSKLGSTRWLEASMNADYVIAGEYGTKNASGTDITPASNNVTFTKNSTSMNTILTAEQAATYTMEYTLGAWATTAASDVEQATITDVTLSNNTLSWTGTSDAYLIEKDGEFVALTTATSYDVANSGNYTVRAANVRGGFGEAVAVPSVGDVANFKFTAKTDWNSSNYQTVSPITATFTNNAQADYVKFAKDNTLNLTTTGNYLITKVELGYVSNYAPDESTITTTVGEMNAAGTLWNGLAKELVITNSATGSNDTRVNVLSVTYVEAEAVSTLANRNYGTCVTTSALDFTDVTDAKAYIATGLNSAQTAVVLQQVNKVAANTPLIIYTTEKTAAATAYVPKTLDDPDAAVESNLLVAGDGTTTWDGTAGYTYYYIASDQFHKATSGTLQSGKAYLKIDNVNSTARLGFVFADEATSVSNVNRETITNNRYYDLQGRRIDGSRLNPGIYIKDGRKVVVK